MEKLPLSHIVEIVCGSMLTIVLVQSILPEGLPPTPPPKPPEGACIGEPIIVDYAFTGWLEPHACKEQCADDQPRYIQYTDGRATQCQRPPGCNDEGEDKGIFCDPQVATTET